MRGGNLACKAQLRHVKIVRNLGEEKKHAHARLMSSTCPDARAKCHQNIHVSDRRSLQPCRNFAARLAMQTLSRLPAAGLHSHSRKHRIKNRSNQRILNRRGLKNNREVLKRLTQHNFFFSLLRAKAKLKDTVSQKCNKISVDQCKVSEDNRGCAYSDEGRFSFILTHY